MKISAIFYPVVAVMVSSWALADFVELKNGERIEGVILSENDDSIEIEVGKNDNGTIRRVLIIHSSEISSWVADQDGRISREQGAEVNRLGGTEYIESLLQKAEAQIEKGNYNEGIRQFGDAADLAVQNLDGLADHDRTEALKVRAHALRLQLAALEGKAESIEKKSDGIEEEMEDWKEQLEDDIEKYEKDKEDYDDEKTNRHVELGKRHQQSDLVMREEELVKRKMAYNEKRIQVDAYLERSEKDLIKTKTQIKLVEERVDQAEDDVKASARKKSRR
ncbi:hypothetical protein P0Y35_01650 [Kiritimatiellaeota bacterium B1221]|nr:hypothetical protein [Kiritimatiellaeota bacterium B1221]